MLSRQRNETQAAGPSRGLAGSPRIGQAAGYRCGHLQVPGGLRVIAGQGACRDAQSSQLTVQDTARLSARFPVHQPQTALRDIADACGRAVSRPSAALIAWADAQGALGTLFLGLGAMVLLIGAIGVANIMVISMLERRAEIGCAAPGAPPAPRSAPGFWSRPSCSPWLAGQQCHRRGRRHGRSRT
jgi:hypothetical protein